NLLSEHIVHILLEVTGTGVNRIEREGISCVHPASFLLVGSMNPEEGMLKPGLLDRFGLYVEMQAECDVARRREIIVRRLAYERDPAEFLLREQAETEKLARRIAAAKELLTEMRVPEDAFSFAASLAHAGVCAGQRAEILLVETAMAVAAYRGVSVVGEAHVREAARFVLPHRLREAVSLDMPPPEPEEDAEQPQGNTAEDEGTRPDTPDRTMPEDAGIQPEETCDAIEREAQEQPMALHVVERKRCDGEGKRMKAVRGLGKGRYVSSRMPKGRAIDIAVDATLRQAALSQRTRQVPGAAQDLAIQVRSDDLRVKVKERRSGVSILFVVDASGSMGAQKRMGAVKGAILSMLTDAYQKRDKVGMIAFRGDGSELLLPLTSSPTLAYRRLQALRTGGRTPMAHGLCHANRLFEMERAKTPLASQYLILVSDGKSNVPLSSGNAHEDVLRICQVLRKNHIQCIVYDTEQGPIRYGYAKEIAERMDAEYVEMKKPSQNAMREYARRLT
ncbi:MAG TPA: VWA domain-containing protein, partial [Clostridia bacterium]|nr:VWA domain-containing protein [Clostridia bacterium]